MAHVRPDSYCAPLTLNVRAAGDAHVTDEVACIELDHDFVPGFADLHAVSDPDRRRAELANNKQHIVESTPPGADNVKSQSHA